MGISYGTTCYLKVSGTTIGQIISLGDVNFTRGEVDITELADGVHNSSAGLRDNGSIACTYHLDFGDSSHTTVSGLLDSGENSNWLIQIGEHNYSFNGWVKSYKISGFAQNSAVTAEIEIRITGSVILDD